MFGYQSSDQGQSLQFQEKSQQFYYYMIIIFTNSKNNYLYLVLPLYISILYFLYYFGGFTILI
jgi:hypothetical protein